METKKSWPLILKILAFVACAGYVAGLILFNLYFDFQLLGLLIFTIIIGGSIFLFALAVCISSYDRPAFLRIPIIINGFITVPVILIAFGNGAIYVLKSRFSLYGTSQFFPMILSLIAQIFLVVVFHFCIDNNYRCCRLSSKSRGRDKHPEKKIQEQSKKHIALDDLFKAVTV